VAGAGPLFRQSAADSIGIQRMIAEGHIFELFAGLNFEYDSVWVQILGKEPIPYLGEVFSYVSNEEGKCSTMVHSIAQEHAALATNSQRNSKVYSRSRNIGKMLDSTSDEKDKLFCDHCNR
jgi:hypothetical protein